MCMVDVDVYGASGDLQKLLSYKIVMSTNFFNLKNDLY